MPTQVAATTFNENNFHSLCDLLFRRDPDLRRIGADHGYPPMWTRPATYQTLVLTILEQQVSLASAYAAFNKLRLMLGTVTPSKIMTLSDEALRSCYFSRQKIIYVRELARAILSRELALRKLHRMANEDVRANLKKIKGIGDWTADIYLIHALRRVNIFPVGDLALVNSMKEVKQLRQDISKEKLLDVSSKWEPYRSIATMLLWHAYIQKRGIKISA